MKSNVVARTQHISGLFGSCLSALQKRVHDHVSPIQHLLLYPACLALVCETCSRSRVHLTCLPPCPFVASLRKITLRPLQSLFLSPQNRDSRLLRLVPPLPLPLLYLLPFPSIGTLRDQENPLLMLPRQEVERA